MQRLLDFPIRQTFDATLVAYCGHSEERWLGGGGEGEGLAGGGCWCQTHHCKFELKYERSILSGSTEMVSEWNSVVGEGGLGN